MINFLKSFFQIKTQKNQRKIQKFNCHSRQYNHEWFLWKFFFEVCFVIFAILFIIVFISWFCVMNFRFSFQVYVLFSHFSVLLLPMFSYIYFFGTNLNLIEVLSIYEVWFIWMGKCKVEASPLTMFNTSLEFGGTRLSVG